MYFQFNGRCKFGLNTSSYVDILHAYANIPEKYKYFLLPIE